MTRVMSNNSIERDPHAALVGRVSSVACNWASDGSCFLVTILAAGIGKVPGVE